MKFVLKRPLPWVCGLLILGIALVYWPVVHYGFTNYDDLKYVSENPHVVRGLNGADIRWAFTTGHASNWHPLTWLSHQLDVQLFGLQPGWHHLVNLLFHTANSVLLLVLLRRLTGALWRSAFVAALFALHPLHVESVVWIAERKDVLSTFFFMLTLLAYVSYTARTEDGRGRMEGGAEGANGPESTLNAQRSTLNVPGGSAGWYVLALVLFALGLMSKPMLVTLPFVLLLLDYWPLRRLERLGKPQPFWAIAPRLLLEKLPFGLLAAASCVITLKVQQAGGAVAPTSFGDHAMNAVVSYVRYLSKAFWPLDLAVFYPQPRLATGAEGWEIEPVVGAGLVLVALSVVALWNWRQRPWLAMGWLWFVGTLVPVIGVVQAGSQSMADRYMYVPLIGLGIAVVWSAAEFLKHLKELRFALSGGALLMCACAVLASRQVGYWRDDETLFGHTLEVTGPDNIPAHYILGMALGKAGKYEPAIEEFQRALELHPDLPVAQYHIGLCWTALGKLEEAAQAYRATLQLEPGNLMARNNLAVALAGLGRSDEALEQYRELARLQPSSPQPSCSMAAIIMSRGKFADAAHYFQEALQRQPGYLPALLGLGRSLALAGKPDEAEARLREAVQLAPANPEPHVYLGTLLADHGRTNEAAASFATALKLAPGLAESSLRDGRALAAQGQVEAALAKLSLAVQLRPNDPEPRLELAQLFSLHGNPKQALVQYRELLSRTPEAPDALNNLAWLLASSAGAELRDGAEAVRLAEHACQLTHYQQPLFVGTLAAAYAEAGRFEEASKTAERARDLAAAGGQQAIADRNAELLKLYQQGKAYHEAR